MRPASPLPGSATSGLRAGASRKSVGEGLCAHAFYNMVMKTLIHPGEIPSRGRAGRPRAECRGGRVRLGISRVTLSRVLQSAHDLATERAAGLPTVRRLDSVA